MTASENRAARTVISWRTSPTRGRSGPCWSDWRESGGQNQAAWSEFVDRYGRKIYGWCLRWGLQDADAQDVTQIVLLKLVQRMKDFTYDPGGASARG